MERLEVRNLDPEPVIAALIATFGGRREGSEVAGEGWRVRMVPGEPARVGHGSVPVLFYEVEGDRAAEVAALIRRRTMRGGG